MHHLQRMTFRELFLEGQESRHLLPSTRPRGQNKSLGRAVERSRHLGANLVLGRPSGLEGFHFFPLCTDLLLEGLAEEGGSSRSGHTNIHKKFNVWFKIQK